MARSSRRDRNCDEACGRISHTKKSNNGSIRLSKRRERTSAEIAVLERQAERLAGNLPAPKIEELRRDGDQLTIVVNPDDLDLYHALDMRAFGTTDKDVSNWAHNLLAGALGHVRDLDALSINAALGLMHGIEPQDEIEGMLAAQMIAIHIATMRTAAKFHQAKTIEQTACQSNMLNKLARTFTTQMEALNRYRGKGQQKVTVEHVHVYEGGQAIVGAVERTGGRGRGKDRAQPHALGPQVRGENASGEILPRTGNA